MPTYCPSFSMSYVHLMATLSPSSGSAFHPSLQGPILSLLHTLLLRHGCFSSSNNKRVSLACPSELKVLVWTLETNNFLLSNFSVQCFAFSSISRKKPSADDSVMMNKLPPLLTQHLVSQPSPCHGH